MVDQPLLLHHYPQSPVAEKVRVVLGIKDARWGSVEIPRLPPKPLLMPLTGGYRRTPVLQIGARVYCDSQCIIRELERRIDTPTLFPGGAAGMAWGVSRWTDGPLFETVIAVVLGHQADTLPADFAADRVRLYFGPRFDIGVLASDLPHHLAQLRGQLGWMDARLATGRRYMLGDAPGLPDALAYHLVWFLRGRYADSAAFLAPFVALTAWEQRMASIGHGRPYTVSGEEALAIARDDDPAPVVNVDPCDPQRLESGRLARIRPLGDGGDPWVEGELVEATADRVALLREDREAGRVLVHFPRVGYRIEQ